MANNSRVLVTGAGGFLGAHIVSELQMLGHTVISGKRNGLNARDVFLDITDAGRTQQVFTDCKPEYVIHCAAYGVNYHDRDVEEALGINLHGSLNLLNAASTIRLKRFIHIGSCFEYGSHDGPVSEDSLLTPSDIYGSSKAAATILMQERANNMDVPITIIRPFGMWGPGERPERVIPQIISAHLNQEPVDLTSCNVIRDYTYVEDIARQIVALCFIEHMEQGMIINVASGKGIFLRDFVNEIASKLGCNDLLNFDVLESRPTEMKSLVADISRLRSILGEIKTTSIESGLEKMLSTCKKR